LKAASKKNPGGEPGQERLGEPWGISNLPDSRGTRHSGQLL